MTANAVSWGNPSTERVYAPFISDVDYKTCMGFKNVIVHVGINELKNRNRSDSNSLPIEDVFNNYLNCLINLRKYCPNAKFFVSPILPTRIRALNTKALQFNYTLFVCVNPFWRVIDFSSFLDDNLLDTNYCRKQNISTGYKDRIHLGYLGISKLAQIFKDSILKLYTFSSFTYASALKPKTEVFNTPVS